MHTYSTKDAYKDQLSRNFISVMAEMGQGLSADDTFVTTKESIAYKMLQDKKGELEKLMTLLEDLGVGPIDGKCLSEEEKNQLLTTVLATTILQTLQAGIKQMAERKVERDYERRQSEAPGAGSHGIEDTVLLSTNALFPFLDGIEASSTPPSPTPPSSPRDSDLTLMEQVADVLLNVFLPAQSRRLTDMASALGFSTYALGLTNHILSKIPGFSSAAVNYNLNGAILSLQALPQEAAYNEAKKLLTTESAQAYVDLSTIDAALLLTGSYTEDIVSHTEFSSEQRRNLGDTFADYNNALFIAHEQVASLIAHLRLVALENETDNIESNKSFSFVTTDGDWFLHLKQLENLVIDGDTTSYYRGGLSPIVEKIIYDKQALADVSQTQQMALKLLLAGMTQQWTSVASTLMIIYKTAKSVLGEI